MISYANVVFIKGEKKEKVDEKTKEKKVYCSATVECVEDESVETLSIEPQVFDKLKKYSKYQVVLVSRSYTWDGQTKERKAITDAKPM